MMENSNSKKFDSQKALLRLEAALDLMELAYDMMRQKILRHNPHATPEMIRFELRRWVDKKNE